MLKKDYVRDGNRNIIASVTTGFSDTSAIVRDEGNRISAEPTSVFTPARCTQQPGLHQLR
jgi:hypothetical protein